MGLWLYGVSSLLITLTQFTTFTLMSHDLKVNFLGAKIVENLAFFNFKKLCCNYLPFISPFRTLYE